MKYEKMYYSFIGCLVAGTIIQNNMNLSWMYVFIITAGLWAVYVGLQYSSAQREHKEKIQQDEYKFNKQREDNQNY